MMNSNVVETNLDHRRGQTVDYTVERLREAILAGRVVPGQRLIANDLTEELGIGRGSVREAFRRLAAEGLVELVPNRGAVVRRLSRKQVRDLFQIRVNLEGLGARLAAEHIREGDNRTRFASVWETVRPKHAPQPWHLFIQQNRLYHRTIVALSGNDQLAELIENLQLPLVMFQVGQVMQPENAEQSHRDHAAVAEAILAGDPDGAERAMRAHVQGAAEWILRLPDSAFRSRRDPTQLL